MSTPKPNTDETLRREFSAEVVRDESMPENEIDFIITTNAVDHAGDRVFAEGGDFSVFERNAVLLWVHDYEHHALGRALDIRVEEKRVLSRARFASEEEVGGEVGRFCQSIYNLYKHGYMSAVSIGFRVLEWTYDAERGGFDFLKWLMLEYSCCPIPMNGEALAIARSAGVDTQPIAMWAARVMDALPANDPIKRSYLENVFKSGRESDAPFLIRAPELAALVRDAVRLELTGSPSSKSGQAQAPASKPHTTGASGSAPAPSSHGERRVRILRPNKEQ